MKLKQEVYADENTAYIELTNKIWLGNKYIEKELLKLKNQNCYEILVELNRDLKLTKHEILRNQWYVIIN